MGEVYVMEVLVSKTQTGMSHDAALRVAFFRCFRFAI